MTRLLRLTRLAAPAAVLLNLVHPLVHGTPLDGGALDACLQCLDGWAMQQGAR